MPGRYPCVRQQDVTDCGAACLATIASSYGLRIPVARIRQYAGTDRGGTTVMGMVSAAKRIGFEAKGVRTNDSGLDQTPLPSVAHLVKGGILHYVVVHAVTKAHVTVADPAKGIVRYKRSEFALLWSGIMIFLAPGPDFIKGNETLSVWRRFALLLRPNRCLLVETFLATGFLMLLGLGASFYLQILVDSVLAARNWQMLRWLSLGIILIGIFRAAFGFLRGHLLAYVSRRVGVLLMIDYYRHVLQLPMQFFETRRTGEIVSRLQDVMKIRDVLSGSTMMLLVDTATMAAGFGLLCFYSLSLALSSLVMLPLIGMIVLVMNRPLRRAQRASMEYGASLQSWMFESLNGIATVKAFSAEREAGHKAEKRVVRLLRNLFRANSWAISANTAGELVTGIGTSVILWLASSMVMLGELSLGQMIAFHSILIYTIQPVLRLVGITQTIQDAVVAADRLGEILDLETEAAEESAQFAYAADGPGRIEFKEVGFRYGARAQVLFDISLVIPSGSVVALTGESGSGKTTLVKLLMRYYDPCSGRIEVDGEDLRLYRLDTLRSHIGWVDQDVCLFSGSIEENLTLGAGNVSRDAVVRAVNAAGLGPFIDSLPEGLRTQVGERGVSLSGGQRQRLAIARALVNDPPILVLDEATSNLDPQTEQEIHRAIEKLRGRKTVILITHGLGSVLLADWVVVLGKGRIIEQGTPEVLMRDGGHCSDRWRACRRGATVSL